MQHYFNTPPGVRTIKWLKVNITVYSSLPQDERVTRTMARTFAPEFNFYFDFPSPLLWTRPDSDALSLAEILETAEVTFDLWHQIPGSDIGGSFRSLNFILTSR